jgi:hypothetical protein
MAPDILSLPDETESGSAGKQPDKGYSGRRCASGAAGPLVSICRQGPLSLPHHKTFGHRSHASKNPPQHLPTAKNCPRAFLNNVTDEQFLAVTYGSLPFNRIVNERFVRGGLRRAKKTEELYDYLLLAQSRRVND